MKTKKKDTSRLSSANRSVRQQVLDIFQNYVVKKDVQEFFLLVEIQCAIDATWKETTSNLDDEFYTD